MLLKTKSLSSIILTLFILFVISVLVTPPTFAALRVIGGLGLGSSSSSNEVSESEGPLTQLYTMEYVQHTKLVLGVEHLRSFAISPLSTAISFSGLYGQWYFTSVPTPYLRAEDVPTNQITFRDLGYFFGTGFGLGQSARLPDENGKTSNAAGFYLSPRVGLDLQLTQAIGFRSSLIIAMSIMGTGTISSVSLMQSIYWAF
ncbi:MAG TPA: hypothetical protein PLJ21_07845 [Pseudobdellovibrionaceae bacterium]|nr:hypothetical protein [Pseudobdellovibrionaceae bacterium]